MAGIKGRSGRKSWDKEQDGRKLWDRAVPIVLGYLSNQHVDEEVKVRIALEIVKKMIPTRMQNDGGLTLEEIIAASYDDDKTVS